MLVLDTDHLSELEVRSPAGMRLLARLDFSILNVRYLFHEKPLEAELLAA